MAFYQTSSYRNYENKDPLINLRNDIVLANSNITLGSPSYEVSEAGDQTILAKYLLNNTIIRTTNSDDITTDTATNILIELRNKLKAQVNLRFAGESTFPNGTRFTFTVINKSGGTITVNAGANVNYGPTDGDIPDNLANVFLMVVSSQVLLGDSEDSITITDTDY
jgi:hypothetical protein